MAKKKKRMQMQKRGDIKKEAGDIRQIFFGEGQEPLTDALIAELIAKGWDEAKLREMAAMGALYSRPRNSFFMPPEFGQ